MKSCGADRRCPRYIAAGLGAVLGLVASLGAATVSAAPIAFTQQSAFNAAIAGGLSTTYDFEIASGFPASGNLIGNIGGEKRFNYTLGSGGN